MKLTPPKQVTFWISIVAAVVGVALFALGGQGLIVLGLVVLAAAYALLAISLLVKGL